MTAPCLITGTAQTPCWSAPCVQSDRASNAGVTSDCVIVFAQDKQPTTESKGSLITSIGGLLLWPYSLLSQELPEGSKSSRELPEFTCKKEFYMILF